MKHTALWREAGFKAAASAAALLAAGAVLMMAGAPALTAYRVMLTGAFGSWGGFADVLVAWVPLALAVSGALVTFSAGLWNIGIEGQITAGAIAATGCIRALQDGPFPAPAVVALGILAGAAGGALWASLAGGLKIAGGVNEIFGGLGLNYVATAAALWLIFGPWKRPGIGSMSGTEPFPERLWLPQFPFCRLSPWALLLGFLGIAFVCLLLRGTYAGLRMKAVGKNIRAALILGIPANRVIIFAFAACGCMGGVAGALQVVAVYHRLIPSISGGYGYLGIMAAMLIGFRPGWAAPAALLFAALTIGAIGLPVVLGLDSSLAGVLQGVLVLSAIMVDGIRLRLSGDRPGEG